MNTLRAPFPWFGGKSRIAPLVWERFGKVKNYVEPFCGSCAVLLSNPAPPRSETVNDADGLLTNFWRALKHDPEQVARWADNQVSELDMLARHRYLGRNLDVVERLKDDVDFFDSRMAGYWLYGQCAWIGHGWGWAFTRNQQLPQLGGSRSNGSGVHASGGFGDRRAFIEGLLLPLSRRFREVRVICGDFERSLSYSVTTAKGKTAVFLDPPYVDGDHCVTYAGGAEVWGRVTAWCEEHGSDPLFRIALCGYEGTWEPPEDWEAVAWKADGGYSARGEEGSQGKINAGRERIWFSPACERKQMRLFS